MALDQIVIHHFFDEDQPVWNDVVRRAIEIAHDAHPSGPLRESCGPLINWKLIDKNESPEKEFQRQLAEILTGDLKRFRNWAAKERDPVRMEDDEGNLRIVFERDGSEIVVSGPAYPRDETDWYSPLWSLLRLIETGLIHDLCWDPVSYGHVS